MNKSKFLKRSLAALLAILMVATMIPSAFAAEGDPVHQDLKITVDTYSATQTENGDYTVTIWDSNDVTINWASIPGTTVTLVTGGKNPGVRLGLPQTLFLAENATIEGEDVYSVTLMEKVGSAEEVPHKLTITVESTIPDWNANLSTVRVDKTSGEYDIGYLTGNKLAGYDVKTKNNKMEAHAIKGEVDNDAETVTITLPFGMTPDQAGFGNGDITTTTAALVFAAESVHAKVAVTGDAAKNRITGVTVTAMDGTQKNFKVVYKQEKIFESFTGETNLSDLEKVPDPGDLSELDVELTAGSADFDNYYDYARNTAKWVPEFATTANVQRIMGTSGNAEDTAVTNGAMLNYDNSSATAGYGEFFEDATTATPKDNGTTDAFLKLITSNHASWGLNSGDEDVVYLLVRTKANPLGAFVQVNLKAVAPAPAKAYITEVQTEDTQSVYDIDKDTRNITLTVDNTYTFKLGATPDNIDINDKAAHMTLHINTDAPSTIDLPQLESGAANNTDGKWWEDTSAPDYVSGTHHIIKGVMGKSGSVLVRVYSADKSYIDYTINFTTASSNSLGLKQIELRKWDGTHIQSAVVDSDDKHTFYLKVPYSYHAGKPVTDEIADDLLACQLLVFPDAGAVVKPGSVDEGQTPGAAFENAITTMGSVWVDSYTDVTGHTNNSAFEDTLYLTVSNGDNGDVQVYQLILQREKPLEEAEITAVTANKALDDDYIFSVASTLGTQIGNTKDVGQAYAGAIDKDGNELPATVDETTRTIKIQVPYDWDNDNDTLYLTGITKEGYSFHRVQNTVAAGGAITPANKLNNSLGSFVLDTINQEDQTNKSGADTWMVGFTNLTTNPNATKPENIIYVFSEKDRFPNVDAAEITPTVGDIKDKATKAYKVYIEKVGNANTGNALSGVSATGATASFNSNLGLISVSVPGSYNWTSYRADNSKDFKLTFSTSTGALVIDKKKYEGNKDIATGTTAIGALKTTDGKYIETMTGVADNDAAKADAKVYLEQLNEFYDLNDAIFFVKNGELYTYDELSGKETQVTGLGGRFTNSNWGAIKTKQAEIRVYREDQSSFRNYRLDLKVGEPSSAKDITSLKVGDVTAAKNGSSFTANLPEEAEKEQALTIEASPLASVMVNGEPYQADRLIDVSKEVTIVVTAENGSTATYTLTTTFGNTPPGPDTWKNPFTDVKEGDWYYNAVKYANENGLMDGTSATKFSPRVNLTRAQFAQILYNAEGNPDVTWTDKFSDVKEGAWYAKAVIWAAENNVLAGYANGTARPNSIVTREDLVSLLWRYAGKPAPTGTTLDFSDASKVSSYAKDALLWAVENKIISGRANGELDPKGNAQRAEAAQMLMQYFSNK